MARRARNLRLDQEGRYHIRAQVAGPSGYYPLQEADNALQLVALLRHYTRLYFCSVLAFSIMGSHYHLVCRFEPFRRLSRQELLERAAAFYPDPRYQPYWRWSEAEWERFNRRLFSASELMRNVQGAYARWFNRRWGRKGRFWADRFHLTESENLLETVLYVELNPVRAHLTQLPEQWGYGSAWLRRQGQDDWLESPERWIGPTQDRAEAARFYWTALYWRGTEPSRAGDGVVPKALAAEMVARLGERGSYRRRIPGFSRGLCVGTEEAVQQRLAELRAAGAYRRRRHAIPLGAAGLYMLREQRSNFVQI
jgi:REP element-mobilizing transposase RayT